MSSLWCSDCDYDMVVDRFHLCTARKTFGMWTIYVRNNVTGRGEDKSIALSLAESPEEARSFLYGWYQVAS